MAEVNFLQWLKSISWMTSVNFGEWLESIFRNDSSQFSWMIWVNFLEWPESIFFNDPSQFSRMTRVNFLEWLESIFGNNWSQSFPAPPPIHPRPGPLTPASHPTSSLSIYWLEPRRPAQTERKGTAHSKLSDPPHHPVSFSTPRIWLSVNSGYL